MSSGTVSTFALPAVEEDSVATAAPLLAEAVNNLQFSGFLSIRGGTIAESDLTYLNVLDDKWTFSEESVFGLQMDSKISEQVNVSLQMTSRAGSNPVNLEWAYLEYAFAPDLKARFGRLRAPGFMLSEFLGVGYAYPWAQIPYEVYGWLPFSRYEGMDLRYWMTIAEADVRFNPYLGTTSGQELSIGEAHYTDQSSEFAGLDVQITYDILTVRAGYSSYKFVLSNSLWDEFIERTVDGTTYVPEIGNDFVTYFDGVKMPGLVDFVETVMVNGVLEDIITTPGAAEYLGVSNEQLRAEQASLLSQLPAYQSIPGMDGDVDGSFAGIGFSLDNGNYLVMSEISAATIGGVYPDVESGYVLVGYRFGNWMPNVTFAKMYTTDDKERPELKPLQLDPAIWSSEELSQLASGAMTFSNVLAVTTELVRVEQETFTLGLRWDPSTGIAVKAELFRVNPTNTSYGFSFPQSLVDLGTSKSTAATGFMLPDAPDKVDGMRLSVDAVF